jgi:hypothetical protein
MPVKVAKKILSLVEVTPNASNQHEFNGVASFKKIFGSLRVKQTADFTTEDGSVSDSADVTWYDAREAHETRSEYRLYFQTNAVMRTAKEGDILVVISDPPNRLRIVLKSV